MILVVGEVPAVRPQSPDTGTDGVAVCEGVGVPTGVADGDDDGVGVGVWVAVWVGVGARVGVQAVTARTVTAKVPTAAAAVMRRPDVERRSR
ncbi:MULTISPECIES: hypothetical protein [unclassified Frankia]|uniref:hypothetical protein n=1 Tax=unclassified Frankia TaxID=2632575 RepID=UPI002AD32C7A|nr:MULTISPECIES: hypothetical protein [unclassified Frankia]